MRRFFELVTSYPRAALALAAAVTLVLAVPMTRLSRDTGPDAFIPSGHPALAAKESMEAVFGVREPLALGIITDEPDGVFHLETLRLVQYLTELVRALPGLEGESVTSIATESGVYFEDGEPAFAPLLREIPTDPRALAALRNDILGYELYRGTLVAADGSAACIVIYVLDEKTADDLYRSLTRILDSEEVHGQIRRGERLVVAGEAAVRAHMGRAVSDDALRMNLVCPVIMALLITLAYRTVRGIVLPLCVVGGASATALGPMAAAGVPVYIVTNGIFVIIMALGVADSLHLLGQYYEEQLDLRGRDARQVIVDSCMLLRWPLVITTVTDVAGFFALFLVGQMPPIRYFGLFTCMGVLGAIVYSFVVVPAGLAAVPLRTSRAFTGGRGFAARRDHLDWIGRGLGRLGAFCYRRSGIVLAVNAVVLTAALCAASRVTINDARILAFKEGHPLVRATRTLNNHFDGTSHLNVVVTASSVGGLILPQALRRIEALEAFTESLPHVGGTHSLAGWVKRAHQKMNEEDPGFYKVPEDPLQTRFYLDVLSNRQTSPMARRLLEVVDDTYTRANLIVRMKSSEYVHERIAVEMLEHHLTSKFNDEQLHGQLTGRVHLDYHWLRLVGQTHVRSVAVSVACVLILTGVMFRSVLAGVLCTLTVALSVLVNYAIMGMADIPLGVGTSMFASIAIGAGVNFPIHLLDRLGKGLSQDPADRSEVFADAVAFTGRALFFTAFVVAAGFLLLCVSEFRTLIHFGLLIGISTASSFILSVTLLPAVVAALGRLAPTV